MITKFVGWLDNGKIRSGPTNFDLQTSLNEMVQLPIIYQNPS